MTAMTASRMASKTAKPMIWSSVIVRIEPKRIDCSCCDAELDMRAKNRPSPVANARTVPVAISRSEARLPSAAMTSAPTFAFLRTSSMTTRLSAPLMGVLAGQGIAEVTVYKKPVITISGVKDNSFLNVNGDPTAANARINVNIKDEYDNFKNYNITLTRSNVITNGKTLRKEAVENMTYLLKGRHSGTSSSAVNIPIDIPADGNRLKNYDGIYTLTVKSADKAANKQDKQITFSVNRFGSVYALSQDLYDVVTTQNKYWKTEDLKGKALEVYEIKEVANFENVSGQTAFDVIDETLYGKTNY